ncbi:MAG: hypothetical protein WD016_04170 [Balneolaceae bacterium]
MKWIITVLLLTLPFVMKAQVADIEQIQKVESGQFNFAKGEILATFTDTVSPDYVIDNLKKLGYEILELSIKPITARTAPNIADSILTELSLHPFIEEVSYRNNSIPEKAFQEMVERENRTEEEIEELRKRFETLSSTKFPKIEFKFHITEEMITPMLEEYSNINFKLNMVIPRTAVVKTNVGEEEEVMRKLEQLIYIKNTAFIGMIED